MKNIVLISASPRRGGNSDTLCDQFLRGAQEAGHRAEKIFLRDHTVGYCVGCGLCNRQPGTCSQRDAMAQIAEKLQQADVIVLATPVYFYTMDAQLKTLIDRCCPYYTALKNKEFYFLVTAADTDPAALERTVEGLRGFTSCLDGPLEKGVVYGAGAWNVGDIETLPAMQEAYRLGRNA